MFNYYLITSEYQSYVLSTQCIVKNIQNTYMKISIYQTPTPTVIICVIVGMQQKVTLHYTELKTRAKNNKIN